MSSGLVNHGLRVARRLLSGTVMKAVKEYQARGEIQQEHFHLSSRVYDILPAEMVASRALPPAGPVRSATWFVPLNSHVGFGGMQTIFRVVDQLAGLGVKSRIVVCDNNPGGLDKIRAQVAFYFPRLAALEFQGFRLRDDSVENLPPTDIAFCTFWETAYVALRFNQTGRKFYFIQDFEPSFYEGGSFYALAEATYRFGFEGIFNTPGLGAFIKQRYGMSGLDFTPAVDRRYDAPRAAASDRRTRIFFYARPGMPRNAFLLGVLVMRHLLARYGSTVEIVTAGGTWAPSDYGLAGVRSLGLLPGIDEVAALYRTCDIGFVFMLSKHPSYQPLEFMASGMATVTNINEDNLWLLKDGENCLLAQPSPACVAAAISRLVDDPELRRRVVAKGRESISFDWGRPLDEISNFVLTADCPVVGVD